MPDTGNYSTEARALLCQHCGGPLRAAVSGGRGSCSYCGTVNVVHGRDDSSLDPPDQPHLSTAEHFACLRAQDGEERPQPAFLSRFLRGGILIPERAGEALELFRATCEEIRRTRSPDAAERLHWLCMVIASRFAADRDHARRRAVLETALDVFFLRRHVQVVRCMLAEAAASEGDVEAAVAWLAPCSGRTAEIESDSALRVAASFVHTVRGDYESVLRRLGTEDEEVPIHDARDPMAAVLRANALEKMGRESAAVSALLDRMKREGASGRRAMEAYVQAHPELMLCARSLPIATERFRASRARGFGGNAALGVVLIVVSVFLVLFGTASWIDVIETGRAPQLSLGSESNVAGVLCAAPIGAIVLFLIGWVLAAPALRNASLTRRGVPAWGTVTGIEGTGINVNDVPQVRVRVRVERAGSAPFSTTCVTMLSGSAARLTVGAEVPVLVDPTAPSHAVLELD